MSVIDFNWEHGELSWYERKLLYGYVLQHKPNIVFEVGTGHGGSSYYILQALRNNNAGHLYTCDTRRRPKPLLRTEFGDIMHYYRKRSRDMIKLMKQVNIIPDFLFFDGPDDPDIAYNDFLRLEGFVKKGTIFSMHDWEDISSKAELLRPYLKENKKWKILFETEVSNDEDKPSVGMVFAQKISN